MTQILVIFVIWTQQLPWASMCVALILSLSLFGQPFGLTPQFILAAITIIVVLYLLAAQIAKRFTYTGVFD